MFRVYTCLTVDHDWRLVLLAVAVCFLASAAAVSLLHRAQATIGRTRLAWLSLDAAAAGCGTWATHFIAMLAYDPGIGAGYNLVVTILSLLIAVLVTGVGLGVALLHFARWTAVLGGAVVGSGIAAMHYTGMMALEVPGRITWVPNLVVASVLLGIAFGALAVFFAARRDDWPNTLIAIFLLTFAIVGTHFTGMGAVLVMPDPAHVNGATSVSPASLSLVIAGVAAIILGICLVAALSDRQSKGKLRQQKIVLDTALENMSQGLCMFDADGNFKLFNERYAKMMGMSAAWLKGRSLLDLFKRRKASGEFLGDPEGFFARVVAEARQGKFSNRVMQTSGGRVLRVVDQPMRGPPRAGDQRQFASNINALAPRVSRLCPVRISVAILDRHDRRPAEIARLEALADGPDDAGTMRTGHPQFVDQLVQKHRALRSLQWPDHRADQAKLVL